MLPLGVLIPTKDSMAHLPGHVENIRQWQDLVEEIVVVDSFSKDGTLAYLKSHLSHPRLRFLTHPPGLYESWNHGIAHINASCTYIATIGDTITRMAWKNWSQGWKC